MHKKRNNIRKREKIEKILNSAYTQPGLSKDTNEKIDRWLLENEHDPDHQEVMAQLYESDFHTTDKPSPECIETLADAKKQLGMTIARKKLTFYLRIASVAAVILTVIGISYTLNQNNQPHTPFPEYNNPELTAEYSIEAVEGVQKEIILADNSRVWINSTGKLTCSRTFENERHVQLEGEAYFEVSHDETKPFLVHTEHLVVKVLGTEFNVAENKTEGITEVTLHSGSVQVTCGEKSAQLTPGEKLTYHHTSGAMDVETLIKEAVEDWRTDIIYTTRKTVPELLVMIANYYDATIHFDPAQFTSRQSYALGLEKDGMLKALSVLSEISGEFTYETDIHDEKVIYIK